MRLEARAKAGYYPTPDSVVKLITSCLGHSPNAAVLDPCCGTGDAVYRVAQHLGGTPWGLELSEERFLEAQKLFKEVRHGDAMAHQARGFSLLYLNPPYDWKDGNRLEVAFLEHFLHALVPGGLLVFIIPEYVLEPAQGLLRTWFHKLRVFRFPPEEYEAYRQVVVFGVRTLEPTAAVLPELEELTQDCCRYRVPPAKTSELIDLGVPLERVLLEASQSPAWRKLWDKLESGSLVGKQPLMPLRKGHLALLVAGGLVNDTVIEQGGRRLLLRGQVAKRTATVEADRNTTVEREYLSLEVTALDLDTAELIRVG